jgi:hypothetical protein
MDKESLTRIQQDLLIDRKYLVTIQTAFMEFYCTKFGMVSSVQKIQSILYPPRILIKTIYVFFNVQKSVNCGGNDRVFLL